MAQKIMCKILTLGKGCVMVNGLINTRSKEQPGQMAFTMQYSYCTTFPIV